MQFFNFIEINSPDCGFRLRRNHCPCYQSEFVWIVLLTLLVPEDPKNLMLKVILCDLLYNMFLASPDNLLV
jgi:hypothetical protein